MRSPENKTRLGQGGFSLAEIMIGATIFSIVMAAIYTSSTALLSSMTASENYSVGQLQAMDYMSLDLRRATSYTFPTVGGVTVLTLPLNLTLPQYYASDGRTPNAPKRTLESAAPTHGKKKHKVFSARYVYSYGTLGGTVAVQYYLSNGILYRKEGSLPAREIGKGIAGVTFGPSAEAVLADPVVTVNMTFLTTKRAKQPPPPLSSTTFMRQYYYSDYN